MSSIILKRHSLLNQLFKSSVPKTLSSVNGSMQRAQMSTQEEPEVLVSVENGTKGVITLNRPKALNALSLNMIRTIYPQLCKWQLDSNMKMVLIKGNGKAFCAGGDVRTIAVNRGSPLTVDFFREEYRMNNKIASLGIPYLSLINGYCIGGGVGISVHGTFRVVTENTVFSMPECQIGFFPDVGASYFLQKLPGKLGVFLGLTGRQLKGLDIVKAGIGTHFVKSTSLPHLEQELLRLESPDAIKISHVLSKYEEQYKDDFKTEFSLKPHTGRMNATFAGETLESIVEALKKDNTTWSQEVLADLAKCSPLSLKLSLEMWKRVKGQMLVDCLKTEYRVSQNLLAKHDNFYTGVIARLVDKSNNPQWNPGQLEQVTDELVNSMFTPIANELELEQNDHDRTDDGHEH